MRDGHLWERGVTQPLPEAKIPQRIQAALLPSNETAQPWLFPASLLLRGKTSRESHPKAS